MLASFYIVTPVLGELEPIIGIPSSAVNNSDWHDGDDISTSDLNIKYTADFDESSDDNGDGVKEAFYRQKMEISYKDSSKSIVAFDFLCAFEGETGVNIAGNEVTDWNDLDRIEPTLAIDGTIPAEYGLGGQTHSETVFSGFDIYNGSSSDLGFINNTSVDSWYLSPDSSKQIGRIDFWNRTIRIGEVTTNTDTIEGLAASIVTFDVEIDAAIGDTINMEACATVLSFTITHTINYTMYKYGAKLDWSTSKAFPTFGAISSGDPYCLIMDDRSQTCVYAPKFESVSTFTTDADNVTKSFTKNEYIISQMDVTETYNITGGASNLDTNRKYFELQANDGGAIYGDISYIFTMFDGFEYGVSEGVEFDPTLIVYTGASSGIPGYSFGILALSILFAVAVIFKKSKRV